ncbi:hypothetical protein MMC30_004648 [Trapelia coarctata]|nr:hypothetical protein [Trapelia coarctata]
MKITNEDHDPKPTPQAHPLQIEQTVLYTQVVMPPAIHPIALTGFSKATSYDAHRPSYPPVAVSALLEHLEVANEPHNRIVDLAAGTMQRREGYEILAVEPHEGMRGVLEGKGLKGVKVLEGSAEKMTGVEKEWADAVIVAQAFHWFAKDEALQEIYRVLKPGGALGLIWNVEDYNSPRDWILATKWEGKLKEILWSVETRHTNFDTMNGAKSSMSD